MRTLVGVVLVPVQRSGMPMNNYRVRDSADLQVHVITGGMTLSELGLFQLVSDKMTLIVSLCCFEGLRVQGEATEP